MKLKTKRFLIMTVLFISIIFTLIPSFSKTITSSDASFGLCGNLGSGLGNHQDVKSDVIASDAANRKWTIQELFSNSIGFTSYFGEGDENWLLASTGDRSKDAPFIDDAEVQERIKGQRSIEKCITGSLGLNTGASNALLQLASVFVSVATNFVTKMFSGDLICTDVNSSGNSSCINLIGIVGGKDENGGIIGSLRDSIFMPLAFILFICAGVWLLYKGVIKREFRTSLMGVIWSVFIFMIGIICLFNPTLLASVPQQANSIISTCLVGAMNGQNCITGDVQAPSSLVGEECKSTADTQRNEGAALATNAMTCSIWKSFVLDAWSRAEFGKSYSAMYISDPPTGGSVIENVPDDISQYGVALNSTISADKLNGETLETNGDKIYNLALYQLYISTNMKTAGDENFSNSTNDSRWFNVIGPVAKDDSMWSRWAPTAGGSFVRFFTAFSSMIVAFIVSLSLVIFAFWGLIYMISGTILMAFAPLFFLIAIEPGRGRKLFLGWLESVVSSILKFMASALFVIVSLTLYSSILSSTDSYVSAFIGIIIMVGTLLLYRKEIVNLLGMANLGGQKLSNAVGEKIKDDAKKVKENSAVVAGGALGGMMAAKDLDLKGMDKVKGTLSMGARGAMDSVKRQSKRGNNSLAGFTRQYDASKRAVDKKNETNKNKKNPNTNETNNTNNNTPNTTNPYTSQNETVDKNGTNQNENLKNPSTDLNNNKSNDNTDSSKDKSNVGEKSSNNDLLKNNSEDTNDKVNPKSNSDKIKKSINKNRESGKVTPIVTGVEDTNDLNSTIQESIDKSSNENTNSELSNTKDNKKSNESKSRSNKKSEETETIITKTKDKVKNNESINKQKSTTKKMNPDLLKKHKKK